MAIVDKTIGNLTGKWDDKANKWVSPPALPDETPSGTDIDRNVIVSIFASENKLSELDNWMASSRTVQAYFSSSIIKADYVGLTLMIGMVDGAEKGLLISKDIAQKIKEYLVDVRSTVKAPD